MSKVFRCFASAAFALVLLIFGLNFFSVAVEAQSSGIVE